jgi:nucleoside phosphorylase
MQASQRYRIGLLVPLHEEYQYLTELAPAIKTINADGDFYYQLMPPGYTEPIIAQVLEDMGELRAAVAADRLITRFGVEIVALVGIAGGLDRDLLIGDVVVASEIDHYQYSAKASASPDGSPSIQQAGKHWRASHTVLEIVRSFSLRPETRATYDAWRDLTRSRRPTIDDMKTAALIRDRPIDAVGSIASGDVVGAAAWFRDALLRRNRKLLAIEMEGAGVAAAAVERSDPKHFIVARGLSDLADERKADFDRTSEAGSAVAGALRQYALLSAVEYLLRLLPILLQSLEAPKLMPPESAAVSYPSPREVSQPSEASGIKSVRLSVHEVEHFPTTHGDRTLERNLELELSIRYHGVTSIERLLHYADVQWQSISLNDSPRNVWFKALQLAKDQGKLCELLRLAAEDYPGTPAFVDALLRYGC